MKIIIKIVGREQKNWMVELYTRNSVIFFDLLYWMIGDIKYVETYTVNYAHQGIIEIENTGVVILKFQNGAIGTINYTVNNYRKNMEDSLSIFGEKGTEKSEVNI